jgi:hypothetical protein
MSRPQKSRYIPQFPAKYKGNVDNIVCRSGWERTVCKFLDSSASVLWWSSEELVIPYIHPLDGRYHRYFPDFIANVKKKDGTTSTLVIEVKPDIQTRAPVRKSKRKPGKGFLTEQATFAVNAAKWEAAKSVCIKKGWEFVILTEKMANFGI